jgi:hypothetical protein
LPIFIDSGHHFPSGGIQPIRLLVFEVLADFPCGVAIPQMDIRCFPSHGEEQTALVAVLGEYGEFDTGTMRGEAPDNPAATQLNEWIRTTYRPRQDCLVPELNRTGKIVGPIYRGGHEHLGFARDPATMEFGYGNEALMPKAT